MKVIAVIPNYNMRENLGSLIAHLLDERLDDIYVLDDASSDCSVEHVRMTFPGVSIVEGKQNAGAAANRNRILPLLNGDELILFLDADLEVITRGLKGVVESWFVESSTGLVGGLILSKSGEPMAWNYGPEMNPMGDARVSVYGDLSLLTRRETRIFKRMRQMALELKDTYNFEIQYAKQVRREVDWVAEGLFAARASLLLEIGGYDERFRYHADQDLGVRVRAHGFKILFDPGVSARHLEMDVRGDTRWQEFREGSYLFYQKHWGMSREVYERLFPEQT